MIRAMIFDLDGTLVNTEYLKGLSYARAIVELSNGSVEEARALAAFKEVVGRSRDEVVRHLAEKFGLNQACNQLCDQYGVEEPWQVLSTLRLEIYRDMLENSSILRENLWPHNVDLLRLAKQTFCKVGLATMSERTQAEQVLEVLGLRTYFHCIATVDDVEKTKPDPEIYLTVSHWLHVRPKECLVIEDSPSGVKAGVAAGMNVIAVATDFTHDRKEDLTAVLRYWRYEMLRLATEYLKNRDKMPERGIGRLETLIADYRRSTLHHLVSRGAGLTEFRPAYIEGNVEAHEYLL